MNPDCNVSTRPIFLDKTDVLRCLENSWKDLFNAIEKALASFSAGNVNQPVRSSVSIPKHDGTLLTMPAYDFSEDALATKLVTVYPQNKHIGLPSVQSTVLLFEPHTGSLLAIMEGSIITSMRTAAASAVATKYLAKQNSNILSILGTGEQARSHYKALRELYSFEKIKVWNIRKNSAMRLVQEIEKCGDVVEYYDDVKDAVQDADIIITVTMSSTPILMKEWVKKGAHINAVGAPFPNWQELSDELVESSIVYVDSRASALAESGDIILSKGEIYAEIGEMLLGTKNAYPDETTIFKSLGIAVEDVVAAKLVYENFIAA